MIYAWRVYVHNVKAPTTEFFFLFYIFFLESTLGSDVESEMKFPVAIILHRV